MPTRNLALLVAAVSIAVAAASQGSVVVTAQSLGPAQNSSGSIKAVGHYAWLISLHSDSGPITGIDVGRDADAAEGIFARVGMG